MVPGFGHVQITGFAAIRAVVHAIVAETDIFHGLAEGAVFLARAVVFGFIALRANDDGRHVVLPPGAGTASRF
jgi:hypothetical protein